MSTQRPTGVPEIHFDSWDRLSKYAAQNNKRLNSELGWGYEGLVYSTTSKSAIKAYRHDNLYQKERNVYRRMRERGISSADAFTVPRLISRSDDWLAVEMTIVSPPFILDFAGAYLDEKPPYSAEEWAQWESEKSEQFGDRWPEVRSAMYTFRAHGIYLNDVKPGNVTFAD